MINTHNDGLDVVVALVKIGDDLVKVAAEQILIRQKLLIFQLLADLVLARLLAPRHDGHSVIVLLAIEDKVETSLVELIHANAIGALSKDLDLVVSSMLLVIFVSPFVGTNLGR